MAEPGKIDRVDVAFMGSGLALFASSLLLLYLMGRRYKS